HPAAIRDLPAGPEPPAPAEAALHHSMTGIMQLPKNRDSGSLENGGETQAARVQIPRTQPRAAVSPFPSRLELAARAIPGGLATMIHLAWLSDDPRAQTVARRWKSSSGERSRGVQIEQLCDAAGIDDREFAGKVAGAAWELGIALPRFIAGVAEAGESLKDAHVRTLMVGEPIIPWLEPAELKRCRDRLLRESEHRICDDVARLRREWGLSQSQFARLFLTDVRTMKRWQAREMKPTPRHRWLLRLFALYVERKGLRAFRHRFFRQNPRYGKPGRPAV